VLVEFPEQIVCPVSQGFVVGVSNGEKRKLKASKQKEKAPCKSPRGENFPHGRKHTHNNVHFSAKEKMENAGKKKRRAAVLAGTARRGCGGWEI
jgi:hypothetical protein